MLRTSGNAELQVNELPLLSLELGRLITREVRCQGTEVVAVIDTGAVVSVRDPSLATKLALEVRAW